MRGGSVRIEGKPWDRPRVGPSELPVQSLRRGPPLCVQCQEAKPSALCRILDGSHQASTQPRTTAAAMYQQLGNLRPMRLVRCPSWMELDGTNNPFGISGEEKDGARVGFRNGPSPPLLSPLKRQRREKTHGRSRLDRVYQKLGKSSEIRVPRRRNQSLDRACLVGHVG